MELASRYNLKFEYIKGIKSTLADTMSRLVKLNPDIQLEKEPNGYQFVKPPPEEVSSRDSELKLIYIAPTSLEHDPHKDPIPLKGQIQWGISLEDLLIAQKEDKFCKTIRGRIQKEGPSVSLLSGG